MCAVRTFGITADRVVGYSFVEMKSVSPIRGNVRYKSSQTPVFSHQEAPGYKQNKSEQNPRGSAYAIHCVVIKKTNDKACTNSVYLPSAQIKNERHNAEHKILKRKRPQLTRIAQTILVQTIAVSGNDPAAAVPLGRDDS